MELAEKRYEQWLAQQGLEPELRTELDTMQSDAEKITDAFYRDLEFGTAGLRGVLGAGTNRMNVYVIRRATQAVAQYLNETDLPKTVAIGHDSRIKSDVFAREAAAVFAANGITAYLYPRLEPVPALSFAVRHLHCGLGVCVTASHNPAEYNGYKVYGADGCQMTPEAAKRVVALLEHMDYFSSAKTMDFDAALAAGSIRYIPDGVLDAYVDAVYAQRVGSGEGIANLKLVYTPLNGAGLECVKKLTQKLGIRNMTIVKEQEQPDGHFPTCPYPNPEIRQAMEQAPENVTFAGFVDRETLREAYCGADVFAFMSHEETEGIVVLEALACGIPTVVRDIPVYNGWLREGQNVYKASGTDEFQQKAEGLLTGTLPDLTAAGRRVAEERSLSVMGERLREVYRRMDILPAAQPAAKTNLPQAERPVQHSFTP